MDLISLSEKGFLANPLENWLLDLWVSAGSGANKKLTTWGVGGKKMYLLKGSVDYGNAVVTTQEVYSTMIDEYAFNFIVTYTNDESKAETD
ncbi:hypothetical protein [Paenibacillus sp. 22594]|uniref:hypothetical protein n=1 Tax=Paenibacillus sp. 22594 TaxID=3453947 RepID=UPI003F8300FC